MRPQLLLICPECEQKLTPEEMSYGHDCEVFAEHDEPEPE